MRVIIHNDDLGLTYGFTQGILECFKKGITTSTCIRTNGYAYNHSVGLIKKNLRNIGLGLHLNITQGPTETRGLANRKGQYQFGFLDYFIRAVMGDKKLLEDIEKDFEAQFKIAKENNLMFDHLNSQDHVHMIPAIFDITCRLAKKHRIKYVRICDENYHLTGNLKKDFLPFFNSNFIKFVVLKIFSVVNRKKAARYGLLSSQNFYGVLQTNNMDEIALISALKDALKRNLDTVEILSHPTRIHHKKDDRYITQALSFYANLPNRDIEKKALLSKNVVNFIQENKIKLVNYKNL